MHNEHCTGHVVQGIIHSGLGFLLRTHTHTNTTTNTNTNTTTANTKVQCVVPFVPLEPMATVMSPLHHDHNKHAYDCTMTCLCCTPVPHSPSGRIRIGRNPKGSTEQVQKFKRELRRLLRRNLYRCKYETRQRKIKARRLSA